MAKRSSKRAGKKGGGSDKDNGSASASPKKKGKGKKRGKNHKSQWGTEEDVNFRNNLLAGGYAVTEMAADGNCLFRSLSDQLHEDNGNQHGEVRSAVCDYIEAHEEEFSVFLVLDENEEDEDAADFESYVSTMRQDGEWAGNLEIVAAGRLYRRNITVFSANNLMAMNIPHGQEKSDGEDLLLSYHDSDHYSSVHQINTTTKTQTKKEMAEANPDQSDSKTGKKPKGSKKGKATAPFSVGEEDTAPTDDSGAKKSEKPKQSTSTPRKSAPCHCGSGKKYRRCCWAGERRERLTRKAKGSDDSTKETDKSSEDTFEMNGTFRVLQI